MFVSRKKYKALEAQLAKKEMEYKTLTIRIMWLQHVLQKHYLLAEADKQPRFYYTGGFWPPEDYNPNLPYPSNSGKEFNIVEVP